MSSNDLCRLMTCLSLVRADTLASIRVVDLPATRLLRKSEAPRDSARNCRSECGPVGDRPLVGRALCPVLSQSGCRSGSRSRFQSGPSRRIRAALPPPRWFGLRTRRRSMPSQRGRPASTPTGRPSVRAGEFGEPPKRPYPFSRLLRGRVKGRMRRPRLVPAVPESTVVARVYQGTRASSHISSGHVADIWPPMSVSPELMGWTGVRATMAALVNSGPGGGERCPDFEEYSLQLSPR
jgi:hypothetical protein